MKGEQKNRLINLLFVSALGILTLIGWLSYRNTTDMIQSDVREDLSYAITHEFDQVFAALEDLETGERGYIITGDQKYLEPYEEALTALPARLASLEKYKKDNPSMQGWLQTLRPLIDEKIAVSKTTIELRRTYGLDDALLREKTDSGKMLMDQIREHIAGVKAEEATLFRQRAEQKAADATRSIRTAVTGNALSFVLLFIVFLALKREITQRVSAENELLLHRNHLQDLVNDRTLKLAKANEKLQNEIAKQKETELALRQARDELEIRVQERTAELSHTVATLHDEVVQRSQTEQALRESSDQLRLLASEVTLAEQKERGRLAQVLHDGLQQMLVAAKYWLALLENSKDLKKSIAEISAIIDDAIETSRSLTAELSPPILRQGGLVPAMEWLARWMHDKYRLDVSLTIREPAKPVAEDVAIFLYQAVRELLFNVVKHAGVRTVRIKLEEREGGIQIAIADEGAGFDPARLRTAGGNRGGFGLLSLRERLRYLDGRIEVDSFPNRGTRVTLFVPHASPLVQTAAPAPEKHEPRPVFTSVQQEEAGVTERRIGIVLVDDHMIVRQGLGGLLRAQPDMQVVGEASDGQSALDLVRQVRPDVVLMDIGLPDTDGIEVTRIIHKELPQVNIIGLSMFEEDERAAAMRNAGAVNYLAKSGPSEDLISAIRACIHTAEQPLDSASVSSKTQSGS